jgi:hypothetical protein
MTHALTVEAPTEGIADFSRILDRAFVFDDFFPATQIAQLEKWALQTPHWMLNNSAHDEHGHARHRIWGASYIQALQRKGWSGLPPVLLAGVAATFQKLGVKILKPEYIGLNGQSRGQDGSTHTDCVRDAADQLSILIYVGEDTDGDLLLHSKENPEQVTERISFRPNRVVAFDGSIPHAALAPSDDKFRMSVIVRGAYEFRKPDGKTGDRR